MRFHVKSGKASAQKTDIAIVPVYTDGQLGAAARAMDAGCGSAISRALAEGDLRGKTGDLLLINGGGGLACRKILLVGCGPRDKFDLKTFRKALGNALTAVKRTKHRSAISYLSLETIPRVDAYRLARATVETWHQGCYRFTATKSKANDNDKDSTKLDTLGIAVRNPRVVTTTRRGVAHGDAVGHGMNLARELGNLPPNVCTPSYLVKQARDLAKASTKLTVEVLSEAQMRKLGMGALLSVTAGTVEPARFIILKYQGTAATKKPVALVGKGITFDAGGISLKPPAAMDEMKYDMSGAASVLGVFRAITRLKPSMNVVGLIPTCENLPGGNATKPGDVVTAMSGQTIEVLNTDAEGRLILADALTYAQRFKPTAVVDIATLTGACVIALGKHRSGLLSNSSKLAARLQRAGDAAGDPVWQLPLDEEYMEQLKSNFADVANVGGREAGTVTAGCFLSRFVGDMDWAHLDIAGTAWVGGGLRKGSTGRPVPLLLEFLLNN